MLATFILGIFAVLFAYLTKYSDVKWGLKASFSFIFIFLALRYNFGNDYNAYLDGFVEITKYDTFSFDEIYGNFELGWIILCKLFRPLGFFAFVATLALFNCIVYYKLIEKFVPQEYYWLAVFLYIFSPDFMLIHSSAMRQSFTIALFIVALNYLNGLHVHAFRYFVIVIFASFFHTSSLILIPVYFINKVDLKINRNYAVIIFSAYISLFVFAKILLPYIDQFIFSYFAKYSYYVGSTEIGTGYGLFVTSFLFLMVLLKQGIQRDESKLIFNLAIIGFFFIPIGIVLTMIGRAGMYFQIMTIVVYPIMIYYIKSPIFRSFTITILIMINIYRFFQFFSSDVYKEAFETYQTIISAPYYF
ncbi:MAG: EpsG family protein [Mariniphaga sp.]